MIARISRHACMCPRIVLFALLSLFVALGGRAGAEVSPFRQAVAEAAAGDPILSGFYRDHDYAPVWTSSADAVRRAALFIALDHAGDHGLPVRKYGADQLRQGFERMTSERQRGRLEVALSRAFLDYAHDVQTGFIQPASIDAGLVRAVPERDRRAMLEQFMVAEPHGFFRTLPPQVPQYAQLMKARLDLERAAASGGWGPALRIGKLEPGARGASVAALRDKLVALGYMRASASQVYDGAVAAQIGPHVEVLLDRHVREHPPPFRTMRDAERDDLACRAARDVPALEHQLAAGGRQDTGDGAQRRALAGAVGADQRDELARLDGQRNALQRLYLAIAANEITNL